ncbi:ATP-binding protein [Pseudoalteromonas luteoviolacea]|uniref:ATP-binding protein n=1 Tax=Pseudoalteromonas luteoviolacea TaxID=43657 RepID=UPI00114DEF7C|nr:ATP-binding protein [Pseudoalteromonas luteoviolacea]TQF71250.1 histidine kinase [Pseudoalteromonas luteoviolacea]
MQNFNCLLITDDIDSIEVFSHALKDTGIKHTLYLSATPSAGLQKAQRIKPDCILLSELLLPDADVKALSEYTPLLCIACSDNTEEPDLSNFGSLTTVKINSAMARDLIGLLPEHNPIKQSIASKVVFNAAFLDLVIESIPNYVFVKDTQFRIVRANQQFLSLYPENYRDKVIGSTTIEDYDPAEAQEFLAKDREAFTCGYSETVEKIQFPNGELRTLFTQKKRFTDEHAQDYILGICTDVTEREDLIKKLTKSNQDLERFAYSASHDLKSPLNAIKNLVGWIEEDYFEQLPEGAKDSFKLIKSRSIRMARLLDDLLAYSRVQKRLEDEEWALVDDIIHSAFSVIDRSEKFSLKITGPKLQLPRVAFQIVAMNLLGNAIKHHHKNSGVINIEIKAQSNGHQISFIDDGPGIPIAYSKKIFEMFQTLQSRDVVEGSGMGLALVKKVLDYYEGHVTLNEHHEGGAKFDVLWPKRAKIK